MSRAHARLAPSAAPRWLRCPGSVALAAESPDDDPTEYSAEGTAAHWVRDACLSFGLDPLDFLGKRIVEDGFTFVVDMDMVDFLTPGIDSVREMGGVMFSERRVSLDDWLPGQFGTLDCGIVLDDMIVVNDLKYGAGVVVSPVENEQLMCYALGFYSEIEKLFRPGGVLPNRFLLMIDQPRAIGGGGEWEVSLDDLIDFGERIREAGRQTYNPDAPRVAGKAQCRWCSAKPRCPEYTAFNLELFGMQFDDLDADPAQVPSLDSALTAKQRCYVVRHADHLRAWLADLHDQTINDARIGNPTPGLKMVLGRKGKRFWKSEEKAETFLVKRLDDPYTRKLKSPAQAEKELTTEAWKAAGDLDLVGQTDAKPVLVMEGDRRPAHRPVAHAFDVLDEGVL